MFDALGLANTPVSNRSIQVENNSGTTCSTIPERGAGRPPEFAASTAAITGESKQSINRHLARAEALGDDLERTVGTSQRSSYTKRRKVIWEALHPVANQRFERVWDALPIEAKAQRVAVLDDEIQVAQLAPPVIGYGQPPPQTKAFAAETAAITGESKSQVNRHLARAEALGDDLERTVGTFPQKGENPHRSRARALTANGG